MRRWICASYVHFSHRVSSRWCGQFRLHMRRRIVLESCEHLTHTRQISGLPRFWSLNHSYGSLLLLPFLLYDWYFTGNKFRNCLPAVFVSFSVKLFLVLQKQLSIKKKNKKKLGISLTIKKKGLEFTRAIHHLLFLAVGFLGVFDNNATLAIEICLVLLCCFYDLPNHFFLFLFLLFQSQSI